MLQPVHVFERFPDAESEKGLPYVEPAALAITALMTQLKAVLQENEIIAQLEQKVLQNTDKAAAGITTSSGEKETKLPGRNQSTQRIKNFMSRPPSIRNLCSKPLVVPSDPLSHSKIAPTPRKRNIGQTYSSPLNP